MAASADGPAVPRALRDLLESRLESVSRRTRRVLEVASIVGGGSNLRCSAMSRASPSRPSTRPPRGARPWPAGQDREGTERFEFRHTLLADTIRSRTAGRGVERPPSCGRDLAPTPSGGRCSAGHRTAELDRPALGRFRRCDEGAALADQGRNRGRSGLRVGRSRASLRARAGVADGVRTRGSIDRADIAARASEAAFKADVRRPRRWLAARSRRSI